MTHKVMLKAQKTWSSAVERSYQSFTIEENWKLIEGADLLNRGRGDSVLKDLMIIAAHTGCRLSVLCDLRLDRVGPDSLEIAKSKKELVSVKFQYIKTSNKSLNGSSKPASQPAMNICFQN